MTVATKDVEIDPKNPPESTMVYLYPDEKHFGIYLHFPRPSGVLKLFSFPVPGDQLLDETAQQGSMCYQMRDRIMAKLREFAVTEKWARHALERTNWTSVAACIRAHMVTFNKWRRRDTPMPAPNLIQ